MHGRHREPRPPDADDVRSFRRGRHAARGHGAPALHQRHDGPAEGRGACPRGRRSAQLDGPHRARSASGRHLLVHRRSRLGDRHLLRHHRAADERRDDDRRRGRVRRRALVPHAGTREGQRLVHRADGDPHADEGRRRAAEGARSHAPALHGERRRAAQSGGGALGRRGLRHALPRQLVADRDRRHHDRQLRVDGRQAGLDGPPAAGHRSGHRQARGRCGRGSGRADGRSANWRCAPAGRR